MSLTVDTHGHQHTARNSARNSQSRCLQSHTILALYRTNGGTSHQTHLRSRQPRTGRSMAAPVPQRSPCRPWPIIVCSCCKPAVHERPAVLRPYARGPMQRLSGARYDPRQNLEHNGSLVAACSGGGAPSGARRREGRPSGLRRERRDGGAPWRLRQRRQCSWVGRAAPAPATATAPGPRQAQSAPASQPGSQHVLCACGASSGERNLLSGSPALRQ